MLSKLSREEVIPLTPIHVNVEAGLIGGCNHADAEVHARFRGQPAYCLSIPSILRAGGNGIERGLNIKDIDLAHAGCHHNLSATGT